jgi:hypothetical protein
MPLKIGETACDGGIRDTKLPRSVAKIQTLCNLGKNAHGFELIHVGQRFASPVSMRVSK